MLVDAEVALGIDIVLDKLYFFISEVNIDVFFYGGFIEMEEGEMEFV